jgi:hypothetical protein
MDSPLRVPNIIAPVTVSAMYRKIRLAGSGAVNNGRMNFKNKYTPRIRIPDLKSAFPFMISPPA